MSGIKSPLKIVNEQFGGKDKLVEKLAGLVERGEEEVDAVKKRLKSASNAQLLRLHKVADSVKATYGSKDKLAKAVADLLGRAKDADYSKKLGSFSGARLLDMAQSLGKKAASSAKKAASAKPVAKAKAAAPKATKADGAAPKAAAKKPAAKTKKQ